MNTLLDKFSLESIKWNDQIMVCLILIWLVVVACSLSSIFSQQFERNRRLFWICLIIGLPIVGLLAYLPFSFRREGLPQIFQSRSSKKDRRASRRNRSS